jgi:hypothetical protein
LNQKGKKKKVRKGTDYRERAGRKKERRRKKKKRLRQTRLDCWRRLEAAETVGKGLKLEAAVMFSTA